MQKQKLIMSCPSNCDFYSFSEESCHKLTFTRSQRLLDFSKWQEDEQKTYLWRACGAEAKTICLHHKLFYGNKFEKLQTKCCDVFKIHTKHAKGLSSLLLVDNLFC